MQAQMMASGGGPGGPAVTFGGPTTELGANITHLRPVQVLLKTAAPDPRSALDRTAMPYMRAVLGKRVREGLFEEDVVESAAVYSAGVLRKFFELLRNAAIRAADLTSGPPLETSWAALTRSSSVRAVCCVVSRKSRYADGVPAASAFLASSVRIGPPVEATWAMATRKSSAPASY